MARPTLIGQGGDQHDLTLGEFPGDAAIKPQDPDHLFFGLYGSRENGDDSFFYLLLPVLNPLVRGHVLDHHGLSFQGFGDAFFQGEGAPVKISLAQTIAGHEFQAPLRVLYQKDG